jgi:hypothetical protein
MRLKTQTLLFALAAWALGSAAAFAQGTAFAYHGSLRDGTEPANGLYDLTFSVWNAASGQAQVSVTLTNLDVGVTGGVFTVALDFGAGIFPGAERWLEIGVRSNATVAAFTILSPRQKILATPYAITAGNVTGLIPDAALSGTYSGKITFSHQSNSFTGDGAGLANVNAATFSGLSAGQFWKTAGNSGTLPAKDFIGTSDNQPLHFKVNNTRVMRFELNGPSPNVLGGFAANNAAAGVVGATISGGGGFISAANTAGADYASISGGSGHAAAGFASTIGGGEANLIASNANHAVISGGVRNLVEDGAAGGTISGGGNNRIGPSSSDSSIGGGFGNTVLMNSSKNVLGGGQNNLISSNVTHSVISGGLQNTLSAGATYVTIGGGQGNTIENLFNGAIGGGAANTVARGADYATIGGGLHSRIETNASRATIAGGDNNEIGFGAARATIGGGWNNAIETSGSQSVIGGGSNNRIRGDATFGTISGGSINTIEPFANYGTIGGGLQNRIQTSSGSATIAGGFDNEIQSVAAYATINGGHANSIQSGAASATIGGGRGNTIWTNATDATVGGGSNNVIAIDAANATIGGGSVNTIRANAKWSAIGGGSNNIIEADTANATIGGGAANSIATRALAATIGGGLLNAIGDGAHRSTIGGGEANTIEEHAVNATIAGGRTNVIDDNAPSSTIGGGSGNRIGAHAQFGTIPGGTRNLVLSDGGFAAGTDAHAIHYGSFVWSDIGIHPFVSTTDGQFSVRATGGVRFVTDVDFDSGVPTAGVRLNGSDSSWSSISDRNAKKNFRPVDSRQILERLAQVSIQHWNYKWDPDNAPPHLGPTAQDFKAAFYPGRDDKHISTMEFDGVALAAIQGLNRKLEDELKAKDAEIGALKQSIAELNERLTTLLQRMENPQ